ncbi:TetR/AcrR family transcriptional regulator [Streptomyces wuyuanensis]|uniref:TetR/AcrR family transcriptional regulator n=1 Tax=Streptomyces wuyuanensis TaxID=1196353 RepID=UPI003449B2D1
MADRAPDLVERAVTRPLAGRYETSADEVRRLIEATYTVIERTGSLDPTVRDILRQSGLSNQVFYRHFRSKDDLLIAMLDHGRRQMADHLRHRMSLAASPLDAARAWIEGVLAQATDRRAAARTRPFLAHIDRLAARFPEEQRASEEAMIQLLASALREAAATGLLTGPGEAADHDRDARTVYLLTIAVLHDHLRTGTRPDSTQTDHLVRFTLTGLGGSR